MEIQRMKEILELMRNNNVMGFEVGDFKVTFFSPSGELPKLDENGEPLHPRALLNDELGIDDEEF